MTGESIKFAIFRTMFRTELDQIQIQNYNIPRQIENASAETKTKDLTHNQMQISKKRRKEEKKKLKQTK